MKRITLLLLTGFVLLCSPVLPLKASETPSLNSRQDVTVYVTKTGDKYHRGECSYLRQSKIAMSKKKAIAASYGACSRCKP